MIQLFRNKLHSAIPEIIENLPDLEVLQLWENNFIRSIPQGLEKKDKLGGCRPSWFLSRWEGQNGKDAA
jgi:hypothetical protein